MRSYLSPQIRVEPRVVEKGDQTHTFGNIGLHVLQGVPTSPSPLRVICLVYWERARRRPSNLFLASSKHPFTLRQREADKTLKSSARFILFLQYLSAINCRVVSWQRFQLSPAAWPRASYQDSIFEGARFAKTFAHACNQSLSP